MNRALPAAILTFAFLIIVGCSEGPFWQTGSYVPWVREKWNAEEQIADTLYERKRVLNELVATAKTGSESEQSAAAEKLGEIVQRDQILLMRLHAVQLLGHLNNPTAIQALRQASTHPDSEVRIASIRGWASLPANVAILPLQEIVGSDTNVDVRLAATKALGGFQDPSATNALSLALTDNNPAIQLRATEALDKITGQQIGPNVAAWQTFLKGQPTEGQSTERFADSTNGAGAGSDTSIR